MNFDIPAKFQPLRQVISWLGKEYLRPLGLEADRQGGPLDPTHPFFREVLEKGLTGGFVGKIRESGSKKDASKPKSQARRAVVMGEEAAYWDRGMATSLPGPGLGGAPLLIMGSDEQKKQYLDIFKTRKPRDGGHSP